MTPDDRLSGLEQVEQIVDLVRSPRVSREEAIGLIEQYGLVMSSGGKVEAAEYARDAALSTSKVQR